MKSALSTQLWRKANKEYLAQQEKARYQRNRRAALERVGGGNVACKRCKTKTRIEINHKNGYGSYEIKTIIGNRHTFYVMIARGRRAIDDLELLCHPCNVKHAKEKGLYRGSRPLPVPGMI